MVDTFINWTSSYYIIILSNVSLSRQCVFISLGYFNEVCMLAPSQTLLAAGHSMVTWVWCVHVLCMCIYVFTCTETCVVLRVGIGISIPLRTVPERLHYEEHSKDFILYK